MPSFYFLSLLLPFLSTITGSNIVGEGNSGRATVALRSSVRWIGPGQKFYLIVALTPDDDWHVYWKNPGDSGMPTEFEVTAPDGFTIGNPLYPRPSIFRGEEGITFGYEEEVAFFIPIKAPSEININQAEFSVTTTWLACKKNCVLGEAENNCSIQTNAIASGPDYKDLSILRWKNLLPKPFPVLEGWEIKATGTVLHLTGEVTPSPDTETNVQFVAEECRGIKFKKTEIFLNSKTGFKLAIYLDTDSNVIGDNDDLIVKGLLLFGNKSTDPSYVVHAIIDSKPRSGN